MQFFKNLFNSTTNKPTPTKLQEITTFDFFGKVMYYALWKLLVHTHVASVWQNVWQYYVAKHAKRKPGKLINLCTKIYSAYRHKSSLHRYKEQGNNEETAWWAFRLEKGVVELQIRTCTYKTYSYEYRGCYSSMRTKINIRDVYTFRLLFFYCYNFVYICTLTFSNTYFMILK